MDKAIWMKNPGYNPAGLIDELKSLRKLEGDRELSELLSIDLQTISRIRAKRYQISCILILRILYEYVELSLDQVFELMGVTKPFEEEE